MLAIFHLVMPPILVPKRKTADNINTDNSSEPLQLIPEELRRPPKNVTLPEDESCRCF